jgi:hypothetical protein
MRFFFLYSQLRHNGYNTIIMRGRFTLPNSPGNPGQDFRPHRDTEIPGQEQIKAEAVNGSIRRWEQELLAVGLAGATQYHQGLTLGLKSSIWLKDTDDGRDLTGYNIGGIFNLSEDHHILFSAGSDIAGDNRFSATRVINGLRAS